MMFSSTISLRIVMVFYFINIIFLDFVFSQNKSNKQKKSQIVFIDDVKYYVDTLNFSQKTDEKNIKHVKEELKFTDKDGNVFIKKTSKSFEPARRLSIIGGFILDKAIFDMKLPGNKGLRKNIYNIVKQYLLYKKNKGENPLIIKVASSPEYKGTYKQAKKHNYSLVIERAKVVAKILKIYAKKINPTVPFILKYEIPKDGMNFPLYMRKKLDQQIDNKLKNDVYSSFITDKNQTYLKTLRRAEIQFDIEPKIIYNEVEIKSFFSTKILKAAMVLNDPSTSMEEDVLQVNNEIYTINLQRNSNNHPPIKVESIFVKSIVGDTQAEMHLETLDWYLNRLLKIKIETTNNIIVVFTDEPDSSYRAGANTDVKERYLNGMIRVVSKLTKMNYSLLFVIKNPSNVDEEMVITVNKSNVKAFCDAFYDTRKDKTNTEKLESQTQIWYDTKIRPLGKKTTPSEILKNQIELIKGF